MQYSPDERRRVKSSSLSRHGGQVHNGYKDSAGYTQQQTIESKYISAPNQGSATHSSGGTSHSRIRSANPTSGNVDAHKDKERTIKILQNQVSEAHDTIRKLKQKEQELNERIAQQVQNQVQDSGKFENLSQKSMRPTHIIEKFGLLYTQDRLDAMDELDQIIGLSKYGKHQEMKQKILYGVVVASYKVSYDYLQQLKSNIYRLLGIPKNYNSNEDDHYGEVTTFLSKYFQSTTQSFDLGPIITDVQDQLVQLLPEFPVLSKRPGNASYIQQCCYLTWAMVNQIPPMELEHSQDKYNQSYHTRFHASSDKSNKIKMYIWPTLIDSSSKDILYKGVVWT